MNRKWRRGCAVVMCVLLVGQTGIGIGGLCRMKVFAETTVEKASGSNILKSTGSNAEPVEPDLPNEETDLATGSNADAEQSKVITGFTDFDSYGLEAYQVLTFFSEEKELPDLPESVGVFLQEAEDAVQIPVTWRSADDFWKTDYDTYTFTCVLPEEYRLESGLSQDIESGEATLPWIEVRAEAAPTARSGFQPRLTAPASSNSYFYSNNNIFYASGIKTCTWYAWGRAYEILGKKPALCTAPAECWYDYNISGNKGGGHLPYGSKPRLGAIACWGYYTDNVGHVAVVEKIEGDTVTVSEAGTSTDFHISKMKANGQYVSGWNNSGSYAFRGYIYIDGGGDIESPVIKYAKVIDANPAGYLVEARVTDNAGVERVQFPTWTVKNDQDDLVSNWESNTAARGVVVSGGSYGNKEVTVRFWVLGKDHNFEKGNYVTHVYAYDSSGNVSESYELPVWEITGGREYQWEAEWKGHHYQVFLENLTWTEAKKACEEMGGHLVTITSAEEQKVVEDLCKQDKAEYNKSCFREMYYIGGTVKNGKVSWITGETSSYSPKWSAGQPDNYENKETVCSIYSGGSGFGGGTWNDMRPDANVCGYIYESDPTPVRKIEVTPTAVTLDKGKTKQLAATVEPSFAYDKTVTWMSSNSAIATVSASGLVTAKAAGNAVITAKSGTKTATCSVTVKAVSSVIEVSEIILNQTKAEMTVGKTMQLTAQIKPSNSTIREATWSSSDEKLASVSKSGMVTAKEAGTVKISAKAGNKTAVCTITISKPVATGSGGSGDGGGSGSGGSGGGGGSGSGGSGGGGGSGSGGSGGGSGSGSGGSGGGSGSGSGGSGGGGGSGSGGSGGGGGSSSGGPGGGGGAMASGLSGVQKPAANALPSYVAVGTWNLHNSGRWQFIGSDGNIFRNRWAAIYNPYANTAAGARAYDWFHFDAEGNMQTGWFIDPIDQNSYYLNPFSDGTCGRMMTGWVNIGGKQYYFNPNSDGAMGRMFRNERTPDGYYVGADGVKE